MSPSSAPVVVSVQVNGSGYASDIFRDLVSSFNVLQTGNITVISGKCLLRPLQPDYYSCLLLGRTPKSTVFRLLMFLRFLDSGCFVLSWFFSLTGFLMGLSLVISVTGGFVKRSRRLVCAAYYPQREEVRHTHTQRDRYTDTSHRLSVLFICCPQGGSKTQNINPDFLFLKHVFLTKQRLFI